MTKKYKTIKEMLEELDNPKSLWDRFILNPKMNWLRWIIYNLPDVPRDTYNEIKYFIQRGKRGYSDRDLWDLDFYLATIISSSVKNLKDNYITYGACEKEWISVLDDIVFAFEKEKKIIEENLQLTDLENQRYKRGWKFFNNHFQELWD